jgi:hypothetical protein
MKTSSLTLTCISALAAGLLLLTSCAAVSDEPAPDIALPSPTTEDLAVSEEKVSPEFFCTEPASQPDLLRGEAVEASLESDQASLAVINYTSCPTESIISWSQAASDMMVSRESNVLVFLYPLGDFTGDSLQYLSGADFNKHDVVMSLEDQEALLGDIELWLRADGCVDEEFFDPTSNRGDEFAMWRDWVEQGADASTMRFLCPTTKVVAMGITPQMVEEGELELKLFLTHELYHAFQQDLEIEGKCRELSEDRATANTPWMNEGGAHYFASFITGVVRPDGLVNSGEATEDQRIRMEILREALRVYEDETPELHESGPDKKGAAALLLMIDKGLITHEEIMDGSFFTDCKREFLYPASSPEIQDIRDSWYQIVGTDGRYEFSN